MYIKSYMYIMIFNRFFQSILSYFRFNITTFKLKKTSEHNNTKHVTSQASFQCHSGSNILGEIDI